MFESFNSILKTIDSFVWGLPLIILIISVGLFLTIRLKGLQITKLGLAIKHMVKNEASGDGKYPVLLHFAQLISYNRYR